MLIAYSEIPSFKDFCCKGHAVHGETLKGSGDPGGDSSRRKREDQKGHGEYGVVSEDPCKITLVYEKRNHPHSPSIVKVCQSSA